MHQLINETYLLHGKPLGEKHQPHVTGSNTSGVCETLRLATLGAI